MRRMTMALGRRKKKQVELFVATAQLRQGPGHPFYRKLNEVLAGAMFEAFVEGLCASFYREGGRRFIPLGVYLRMLFIGYFEGIDSQRGIAWRCADSLALRSFLLSRSLKTKFLSITSRGPSNGSAPPASGRAIRNGVGQPGRNGGEGNGANGRGGLDFNGNAGAIDPGPDQTVTAGGRQDDPGKALGIGKPKPDENLKAPKSEEKKPYYEPGKVSGKPIVLPLPKKSD